MIVWKDCVWRDEVMIRMDGRKAIKCLLLHDRSLNIDELKGKLDDLDFPLSRMMISTVRSDFLHSLKALEEIGVSIPERIDLPSELKRKPKTRRKKKPIKRVQLAEPTPQRKWWRDEE